jgi:hypothetical protein
MISWTITVPPTVGTASYTSSASNEGAGAEIAVELLPPPGPGAPVITYRYGTEGTYNQLSFFEAQTLENGNIINRSTFTAYVYDINDGGNEAQTVSGTTSDTGITVLSWDGNVFVGDDDGITASSITYEEQTVTNGTVLTVAYDSITTTAVTRTGALTTVSSSVLPTTRTTTIEVESFNSRTAAITTVKATTREGTIFAYNGNTGQRLIATVIIPENERVYIPDAFAASASSNASLDFGPLTRVARGGTGSGGRIIVAPLIKTQAALPANDTNNNAIVIGDATTITDAWTFRPTYASAIATNIATNVFVYPSPVEQVSVVSTITTLTNQNVEGTSETTTLNSAYLVPVCVSTIRTIGANLLDQQFSSSVYSTAVSNFVLPINETGSESGSGSFSEGDFNDEPGLISNSNSFESAYGLTTCLWGYQELGYVPNQSQSVYARSFVSGRASPADLTNPAQNLQAGGLTLTVPETVLANQSVYLPRPMTSWSYSNNDATTRYSVDAEGATVITDFSNGNTASESGEWQAQGQAATNCNVAGNQQINPGGGAALGQITAIYGPGWYATTNENGVSGVQSYGRVFFPLQSQPESGAPMSSSGDFPWQRLARSSVEQFIASVRYGQGQVGAAYFTTATRNPTTHIVGSELVI